MPAGGIASYKLALTGLAYNKVLTLYIPDFGGAYRVFIDGQLIAESGIVSKNIDEISTVPKAELYPLILTDQGLLKMEEGRYISLKSGNAQGFGIRNIEKVVKTYNGLVKIEHDEKELTVRVVVPEHM